MSKAKLNLLEETIDDLGPQKVVIFARFLAEIAAIKKLLEKKGYQISPHRWLRTVKRKRKSGQGVSGKTKGVRYSSPRYRRLGSE